MTIRRRTLLAAGGADLALAVTRTVRAADGPRATFVITVSGPIDGPATKSWEHLTAELEERGFPTTFVPVIDPLSSFTGNETRAAQIVAALNDVQVPPVILGVPNQGGFLPLIAAARPVRRLVYINATIPQPGKAFIEICNNESVAVPGSILDQLIKGSQPVTDEFLKLRADSHATPAQWQTLRDHIHASPYARYMPNLYEVCALDKLPSMGTSTSPALRMIRSGLNGSSQPRVGFWASSRSSLLAPAMRALSHSTRLSLQMLASGVFDCEAK